MFITESYYTRKQVWETLKPGKTFPKGGGWFTGYAIQKQYLLIFANIDTAGKTGHDFPNKFDNNSKIMTWYGKPNAHSEQPTFKKLFLGDLAPLIFVRWDNSDPRFLYLGSPNILKYQDNVKASVSIETIKIEFLFDTENKNTPPPEGISISGREGGKFTVLVNKYERNPALRDACIRHHGTKCKVCEFDFQRNYGDIGKDFCHVHHLKPLHKQQGETNINPIKDLIPLCANCHSMIHRRDPPFEPSELRKLLLDNSNISKQIL
jgi:5-methylcytosine-specific restriction enzyme A